MGELVTIVLLFAAAQLAALVIAARLPLRKRSSVDDVRMALAFGLAPFLAGAAALLSLAALPGSDPRVHLGVSIALLLALAAFAKWFGLDSIQTVSARERSLWILIYVVVVAACALFAATMSTAFVQNDALEYAMMATALFDSRELTILPLVDPALNRFAAYLPWTHPPLYPALLYLAFAIDGGPGVGPAMRAMAPWFLLSTVAFTYAASRWGGQRPAVLAAFLVAAVPLLFLGSVGGLIDALPVSAAAMLLAMLIWSGGGRWYRALAVGCGLSMALYTHSAAVLLVPLTMAAYAWRAGLFGLVRRLQECTLALAVVAVVAIWPFLHNLSTLGVVVGDNPTVFQLSGQAWTDYFTIMRGIDGPVAAIQYGVLKGWFATEAYGALFWLLLLGVPAAWLAGRVAGLRRLLLGRLPPSSRHIGVAAFVLIGFHCGVVLLLLVGEEILIKNERYLLVVVPAAALLAAQAVQRRLSMAESAGASAASRVTRWLTLAVLAAQAAAIAAFVALPMLSRSDAGREGAFPPDARASSAIAPIWAARRELQAAGGVLSMRPADFYFLPVRMVGFLDPRLLPFYATDTPADGLRELRSLGVTHVHLPETFLPPVYNSPLLALLGDPTQAELISTEGTSQIYRLRDSGLLPIRSVDLSPHRGGWTRHGAIVVGGRKSLATIAVTSEPLGHDGRSVAPHLLGLFNRERSIALRSPTLSPVGCSEVVLHYSVSGSGAVKVSTVVNDGPGAQPAKVSDLRRVPVGDFFLSSGQPRRSLSARFAVPLSAKSIAVDIEHVGASAIRVERLLVVCLAAVGAGEPAVVESAR